MAKKRGFSGVPDSEVKFIQREVERIGSELQARRKERGFTQEELAERLNVSTTMIAYIERGLRMPSMPMLIRMAKLLRIEVQFEPK